MSVADFPPVYCPSGCAEPIEWDETGSDSTLRCPGCGREFRSESGIRLLESAATEEDFPPESFAAHDAIEKTHFWSRSRNLIIKAMLRRLPPTDRRRTFLDVGCGTGAVSADLRSIGYQTVGLDMWLDALRFAAARSSAPTVCCNAMSMPFRHHFDVVGLFDVLEHVADDVGLLRAAGRALKTDGYMVITVPADMRLWSPYDEVFGHKRRYNRRGLTETIEQAGLIVDRVSYYNTLLWPVQFVYRRWQRWRGAPALPRAETTQTLLKVPPRPLNGLLRAVMSAEALWVRRFGGFFGGALIALARRPDAVAQSVRHRHEMAAAV